MNRRSCTRFLLAGALGLGVAGNSSAQIAGGFDVFIGNTDTTDFVTYSDSPGWRFFRSGPYCYASERSARGTLYIGYDPKRSWAHVGFTSTTLAGFKTLDRTRFELVLVNIAADGTVAEPNREWGADDYLVAVNDNGEAVFNTKLNAGDVLRTFSLFDRLVFWAMDGTIVQNLSLGRHLGAMTHLKACGLGGAKP